MVTTTDVFNEVDLDILRSLPEVQSTRSGHFRASVPDSIKQKLQTSMGLDLSQVSSIPFRWMHGDTAPHVDHGIESFNSTYLVYLTEGEGQFELGEESYPMTAGTGFVFPEGTHHAVTGTNGTSRLLLGPMSESGFPVGAPGIYADGQTDTVYLSQVGSTMYYRVNAGELFEITSFPVTITNTNAIDPTEYILPVRFTTDLTITSADQYFTLSTDGIELGSKTVKSDGTKYTITIDGVTDYPGFLNNQNNSYTYVYNLHVRAINGSTLYSVAGTAAGWVGGWSYGTGGSVNYITACSSDGPIPDFCGGIVGSDAAVGGGLYIIGCTSSGTIGASGGGIAGRYAGGNGGTIDIRRCSSTGTIGANAGGIVGVSGGEGGTCEVTRSFSTGTIAAYGGGIFGSSAGADGQASANKCYSRGTIGEDGGGIYGPDAGNGTGEAVANSCYSSGTFVTSNTGIFGNPDGTTFTVDCYAANGTWVDSDAGLDTTSDYISVGINQPYELRNFGSTPYSLETVTGPSTLNAEYYQTIPAGTGSIAGLLAGVGPYSLVRSDKEIFYTLNSTTGVITPARDTPIDVYSLIVRAGSATQYSMTSFILTVEEALPEPPPSARPVLAPTGKGFNFETYNALQVGNTLVVERLQNTNLRFKSFEDYMKYKKSFATLKR
jgi:mannose-6-phosphate isomerase-like protein (cupin superfamily)